LIAFQRVLDLVTNFINEKDFQTKIKDKSKSKKKIKEKTIKKGK
jgi:hypothetical protein